MDKEIDILESRVADLEMQVQGKQECIDEFLKLGAKLYKHLHNLVICYPGTHNLDKAHPVWQTLKDLHYWIKRP